MEQKHDKALVSIAIGDRYQADLARFALPSWHAYADKHGYDILVLTEMIDPNADTKLKSIHWQKLLIGLLPQVKAYDHVVWIDGDIVINTRTAPCVVSHLKEGKIGAIDEAGHMLSDDGRLPLYNRSALLNFFMIKANNPAYPDGTLGLADLPSYFRLMGLEPDGVPHLVNTGLLVYDPKKWSSFFAEVYAKYPRDFPDFENTPLAYELSRQGALECLDGRFNRVWARVAAEHYPFLFKRLGEPGFTDLMRDCVQATFDGSWFMHFAGGSKNPITKDAFQLVDWQAADAHERLFEALAVGQDAVMEYLDMRAIVADLPAFQARLDKRTFLY